MLHGMGGSRRRGVVCFLSALGLACSSTSGGDGSGGAGGSGPGGSCQTSCAHAAAVCPDQFHDTAKCESACPQLSPGQVACLGADINCDFLQRCVGEGGGTATGGGATPAQCQNACGHAANVCPDQFHDTAKCEGACPQMSPGQAACLSVEATCDLLVACVGE
jgi:hypothetical protein